MNRTLAAVALCAALLAAGHVGAQEEQAQQPPCAKLDRLAAALVEAYREKPVGVGLQKNGRLLEIFASPGGETWTAATVGPDSEACVVAIGRSWTTAGAEGPPA